MMHARQTVFRHARFGSFMFKGAKITSQYSDTQAVQSDTDHGEMNSLTLNRYQIGNNT